VREVRLGLVGGGLMGREFASAVARWGHLLDPPVRPSLTAVCDVAPEARAWFEARYPSIVLSTDSADAVFESRDVDAVYVAVPHDRHAELYTKAIRSGKALMAEKPFGIDLAACDRILAACRGRPDVLVRCSSEFPFFPGCQRVIRFVTEGRAGRILEVEAAFLHSSDLDPGKPINWKRRAATCGEYGVMGDLGLHPLHVPLRLGWRPVSVHAPCDTWDNARLTCRVRHADGYEFPLVVRTERIAPGEADTWFLSVRGTRGCAEFTTKRPRTFRFLAYEPGGEQAWSEVDTGSQSVHPTATGGIFEFGFSDAILQMWASFLAELAGRPPAFGCVTPEEARWSHRIFTAALESHARRTEVALA
jgi:predicted dehydrogenase